MDCRPLQSDAGTVSMRARNDTFEGAGRKKAKGQVYKNVAKAFSTSTRTVRKTVRGRSIFGRVLIPSNLMEAWSVI